MPSTTLILSIIPILIILALILFFFRSNDNIAKKTTAVVIGVILICAVLIPVVSTSYDMPDYNGVYYDDYIKIDADSATGALEIVTLSGATYLHAKSVGTGTYTTGTITRSLTVERAPLDVYIIAGQSNAEYGVYDVSKAAPTATQGTGYYYGTPTSPIKINSVYDPNTLGMYSITQSGTYNTAHIGNIEQSFTANYYEKTHKKVYTINVGVGGSSVSSWMSGQSSYVWASNNVTKALSYIDTDCFDYTKKSILWIQGEADTTMPIATYCADFTDMFESFKTDFDFDSTIITETRGHGLSAQAQIKLSETVAGVYLGTSVANTFTVKNGLLNTDNIHYSQLGDNELGLALSNFALTLQ